MKSLPANFLIPNVRPENHHLFVESHLVPIEKVMVGGVQFATAPLKFGKQFTLLGICQHEELYQQAVIKATDVIEEGLELESIILVYQGETILDSFAYQFSAKGFLEGIEHHTDGPRAEPNKVVITMNKVPLVISGATAHGAEGFFRNCFTRGGLKEVELLLTAEITVHLETGLVQPFSRPVEVGRVVAYGPDEEGDDPNFGDNHARAQFPRLELYGFTLASKRTNNNRRPQRKPSGATV